MFVFITPWLFAKNFRGMAVFPFILLRDPKLKFNSTIINHERIHLRQQIELLWIGFFIWYFIEFLFRWVQLKNANKAYTNISFEREAYAYESDYGFLKTRPFWNFLKFI